MSQKIIINVNHDPNTMKQNVRITFDPPQCDSQEKFDRLSVSRKYQHQTALEIAGYVMAGLQMREKQIRTDSPDPALNPPSTTT